mmetsp:Transcript_146015/g.468249  ORF Transcript_146015/g.468249 Transcript_146015/m.468249 type:complete len:352 (-) Transcript_146015:604-1659(-)
MTPFLMKPFTPVGFGEKRKPVVWRRCSSRDPAARRAAATMFLGALGLPPKTIEKDGSVACWLKSHSMAMPMFRSSSNSGASAKRQHQANASLAKASSAGLPSSFPSRVRAATARPTAAGPPSDSAWAKRRAARGPASVTARGCTCLTSSGSSTGVSADGKLAAPGASRKLRTIFLVSSGLSRSLKAATGFSPSATAAYNLTNFKHSLIPTPLLSTTSRPSHSLSTPPAPSFQRKPPTRAFDGGYSSQSRCFSNASSRGRQSAPISGPSSWRSNFCITRSNSSADRSGAHRSIGDRRHFPFGTAAARRRIGPTPAFQEPRSSGACFWQAEMSSRNPLTTSFGSSLSSAIIGS